MEAKTVFAQVLGCAHVDGNDRTTADTLGPVFVCIHPTCQRALALINQLILSFSEARENVIKYRFH